MTECALELKDIRKGFYGIEVLHGINLSFRKGEIYGLVGENGAGKSTLMNVIGGVFPPESGAMEIGGREYRPATPNDARLARIAFIHQELNLFSNLTVAENLFIDDLPRRRGGAVNYAFMHAEAQKRLTDLGMSVNPRAIVDTLPMGVRQTVEIAKALMMDAEIILFDEPTTSLSHKEKEYLFGVIRSLKQKGVTVIYISHILEDVFQLCDRVSVLRDGSMVATIDHSELNKDGVVSLMVGRALENVYPAVEKRIGDVLFEADGVSVPPVVKNVSLKLKQGEILGLFGLMGAGRTELARALFGLDRVAGGSLRLMGKPLANQPPEKRIAAGMAFITEDRRKEGLLMPKPVEDNLVLVKLTDIMSRLGVISGREVARISEDLIRRLAIKVSDKRLQLVANLSGGNQQKVVIGKWLCKNPRMLIMDEPTRGVDVGAKYEIYALIQELAKRGSGVLFISSEMEELMGICDRILVMKDGGLTGELLRGDYDPKKIMYYALTGGNGNA